MNISTLSEKLYSPTRQRLHAWFARQLDDHKPQGAIASLDGVRASAFLIVFLLHVGLMTLALNLWQRSDNPFVTAFVMACSSGVTLFFVLSGFLLFLPYARAFLLNKPWPSAKIFYMRRVFRIFPAYYFSLAILVLLTNPALLQPHNWSKLLPFLTFTMDYGNSLLVNGPYWTLAVEFQYYLFLPLIALGIYGLTRLVAPEKRLHAVVGGLVAMIAWGLGTRWWGEGFVVTPHALLNKVLFVVYGANGKFFEDFAVGMLIAVYYTALHNSPKKELYLRRTRRLIPWLLGLCILLFAFAAMCHYVQTWNYTWSFAPGLFQVYPWTTEFTFALSYGCAVLAILFYQPKGLLRRLFEWAPLRWIGLISYSLYIWHAPVLRVLQDKLGPALIHLNQAVAIGLSWLLGLIISVIFCFFAYILIEKPGMQFSERLRQKMLLQQTKKVDAPDPASSSESLSQTNPARAK